MRGLLALLVTSWTIRLPNEPGRGEAPTSATLRASSIASRAGRPAGRRAPAGAGNSGQAHRWLSHGRFLPTFLSVIAALAACQPGMPQTPPPAWVAELP